MRLWFKFKPNLSYNQVEIIKELNKSNYDKFKRTRRYIYSDLNGSINILWKDLKDKCILTPFKQEGDNEFVDILK